MKSLLGVLSLVIVLVHSQDLEPKACNKTLGPEELHQVDGDWVLHWLLFDKNQSQGDMLPNFTSSHIEIRVQLDNHSLVFHERSVYSGGKCATYIMNLTLFQDRDGQHRFDLHTTTEHKDGKEKPFEDWATVEFFSSSHNDLEILYRTKKHGDLIFIYRRDGQHLDLQLNHEEHRAKAKCLGLSGDHFEEWHYDGHSDFCHKKSALPTLGPEELHKVLGDWVLVWAAHDQENSLEDLLQLNSSHLEVRAQSDNHSLSAVEHHVVGGKCVRYTFNLTFPKNSQRNRLDVHGVMMHKDGEVKALDEPSTAEFLLASENTMKLLYNCHKHEKVLAMYRREGHHREGLQKDHEEHRALAKHLGLGRGDFHEWVYDGSTDFCHRKPAPEPVDS